MIKVNKASGYIGFHKEFAKELPAEVKGFFKQNGQDKHRSVTGQISCTLSADDFSEFLALLDKNQIGYTFPTPIKPVEKILALCGKCHQTKETFHEYVDNRQPRGIRCLDCAKEEREAALRSIEKSYGLPEPGEDNTLDQQFFVEDA